MEARNPCDIHQSLSFKLQLRMLKMHKITDVPPLPRSKCFVLGACAFYY